MNEYILNWVNRIPNIEGHEVWVSALILTSVSLLLAFSVYFIAKRIVVHLIHSLFIKTKSSLDDVFVQRKVFRRIAYLVPIWVLYQLLPEALENYPLLANAAAIAMKIYIVVVVVLVLDSVINSLFDVYQTFGISRQIPVQSFIQVAKLVIYFVATITIISLVIGQSPLKLFAGLGAMTAVLMLIFKDPILGFVAGIQLSYNKIVGIGDWVEIPQHNADGDILEIGLTTVKVQNFDKTITTVPTQSLINESFKNWRGMQESDGRRIKRSIFIDINTISFCDQSRLERYRKIDYISEYIDQKEREINDYNSKFANAKQSLVNGRRITNVGTFRAYVLAYLKNHPYINKDLTLLVRQLAPSQTGLPLEIYVFSAVKDWIEYEAIQADIFDHLLAVAKEFDLRVFQEPTGLDFSVPIK